MARSRNIKPAFFDNDLLGEIDPLGRLLFIGMWTIADFKGDFVWREKRIKAQLLPYDNCDIKKLAINLDNSGFIRFYSDGDEIYCTIVNFKTHQNPHKNEREKGSDIPTFTETMRQAIDLKELTINRDKNGTTQDNNGINRADSLLLIPDSVFPIYTPAPDKSVAIVQKEKVEYTKDDLILIGIDESIARDFLITRKAKKAKLTETAFAGIVREAEKANLTIQQALQICVERNWQSFNAEWVKDKQIGQYITYHELVTGMKPEF